MVSVCTFSDAHAAFNFQTEYGIRFFGYQEETGACSYASIDISSETATMSSLTFTFKTNRESGVLLYSESDVRKIVCKLIPCLHIL